jgi:hypothetical protein
MPYAMLESPAWVPDLWAGSAAPVALNATDFVYGEAVWNHLEAPPSGVKSTSPLLPIVIALLNNALGLQGKNALKVTTAWNNDIGHAIAKFQNDHLWSATQLDPNMVVGALNRYTVDALAAQVFPTDQDGTIG